MKRETKPGNPIVHRLPKDGRYEAIRFVFCRNEHACAEAQATIAVETMHRDSQGLEAWTAMCKADTYLADLGMFLARAPQWKHEALTRDEVLAALFVSLRFGA